MQLLLVVNDAEALAALAPEWQHTAFDFLFTAKIQQHEVTGCVCGFGMFQVAYKVAKALLHKRYHLALKVSLCNAYKDSIAVGDVLNIINEKPGDYGSFVHGEWRDLYDFGLLQREQHPQQRGGFVNMTNSYMDVFLPYKKCVGVSVNDYGNSATFSLRAERYKADCETGDALGFVYPCLYERQAFYHLCVVEKNLSTQHSDATLALQRRQQLLQELLQKL